jgi:hypothetical protein
LDLFRIWDFGFRILILDYSIIGQLGRLQSIRWVELLGRSAWRFQIDDELKLHWLLDSSAALALRECCPDVTAQQNISG